MRLVRDAEVAKELGAVVTTKAEREYSFIDKDDLAMMLFDALFNLIQYVHEYYNMLKM